MPLKYWLKLNCQPAWRSGFWSPSAITGAFTLSREMYGTGCRRSFWGSENAGRLGGWAAGPLKARKTMYHTKTRRKKI
jgi:hypothetical protein